MSGDRDVTRNRVGGGSATTGSGIPVAPLGLGLAGLVPFWGLAAACWAVPVWGYDRPQVDRALVTYAAVILSFLGGIRWGLATREPDQAGVAGQYAVAVLPSLLAWAALLLPEPVRLAVLGLLALGLWPADLALARARLAPPWYGRLRGILSLGAGLALWVGAAALLR